MDQTSDLQLSASQVRRRLDLLSNLAYGFLESGETAADVAPVIRRTGRALGIRNLGFNSFGRILLVDTTRDDGTTISVSGAARSLALIDCTRARDLQQVAAADEPDTAAARDTAAAPKTTAAPETTVDRAATGRRVDDALPTALDRVMDLRRSQTPWWIVTLGTTLLAFCICLQVGVTWQAWASAAAVQLLSSLVGVLTGRWAMPKLFAVALQGCFAGALATALVQIGFVDPVGAAAAIAVNWLILVQWPQVIGAVTDAINADYVSATTRVASVLVAVMGLVIAGAFTFWLGEVLHMEHPRIDELPSLPWFLVLVFSALGAIANALANGGRASLILPAAALGVITGAVNQLGLHVLGLSTVWSSSMAGVVLGILAALWDRRTGFPQQVMALMGITGALMPGIAVFFGIIQTMGGGEGSSSFIEAGITCVGISTGVALGAYLVAKVLRLDTQQQQADQ
ncbi:MAG: threonine/serine exporter family protein [Galactobacter sp.]